MLGVGGVPLLTLTDGGGAPVLSSAGPGPLTIGFADGGEVLSITNTGGIAASDGNVRLGPGAGGELDVGQGNVFIGDRAGLNSQPGLANAIMIGNGAGAASNSAVAIGAGAEATGLGSTALGNASRTQGSDNVAVGSGALSSGDSTVAVGPSAVAAFDSSVALGVNARAPVSGSLALGANTNALGEGSIALGAGATALTGDSAQIGSAFMQSVTLGTGYDAALTGITGAAGLPETGVTVLNTTAVNGLVFPNNIYVEFGTGVANLQEAITALEDGATGPVAAADVTVTVGTGSQDLQTILAPPSGGGLIDQVADMSVFNTDGSNVFLGAATNTANVSGTGNFVGGDGSGRFLFSGSSNVILGDQAGIYVDGSGNVILGDQAGIYVNTGSGNVVIGQEAGDSLTSGEFNVAIGRGAVITGAVSRGIALGIRATLSNSDGGQTGGIAIGSGANTDNGSLAVGRGAIALGDAGDNTAIGNDAQVIGAATVNSTALGNGALVDGISNAVQIGNDAVTAVTLGDGYPGPLGVTAANELPAGTTVLNVGAVNANVFPNNIYVEFGTGVANLQEAITALEDGATGPVAAADVTVTVGTGSQDLQTLLVGDGVGTTGLLTDVSNLSTTTSQLQTSVLTTNANFSVDASDNLLAGPDTNNTPPFTSGFANALIGPRAGLGLEDGSFNVLIGTDAGNGLVNPISGERGSVVSGNSNVAIGYDTALTATSRFDVAIGASARAGTTGALGTGVGGVAIGNNAIITNGAVAVGRNAQALGADGTNTALGSGARVDATSVNSTALGNGALLTGAANTVQIGNTAVRDVVLGTGYNAALAGITSVAGLPSTGVTVLNTTAVNGLVFPNNIYVNTDTGVANLQQAIETLEDAVASAAETADSAALRLGGLVDISVASDGSGNVSLGSRELDLTTGTGNLVGGSGAASALTEGSNNTILGPNTANLLTDGYSNTILGYNAGSALLTGSGNVFIGSNTNLSLAYGSANVVIGNNADASGDTDYNTALGAGAVTRNTVGDFTGDASTAIGYQAAADNGSLAVGREAAARGMDGTNTALGNGAQVNGAVVSNSMALGNGAVLTGIDNMIQLGNGAVVSVVAGAGYPGPLSVTDAVDVPAGTTVLSVGAVNATVFPNNIFVVGPTGGAVDNLQNVLSFLYTQLAP